ncbi:PREDICTED: CD177 antigen [Miniopterus natalensis]|uniref:CD177 antigen n=1 Tax=Miniopterus natalensis TaxID=291302 RepID=UPI0007A72BBC|nr:PREDICTED: CD177 antigen [Miniopterus natalensis]
MSPALLSVFLGLTFMLPRAQTLTCHAGILQTVKTVSELPMQWTAGNESCRAGWGCQDTLMLIENGPQVFLLLIKGCTQKEDHEVRVTQHREGPGLSVVSYTHVCRHKDFCNDLSTTLPIWALPASVVPGSMTCPVCFSVNDCGSATELTCPSGHNHCYNGVLQLRGGDINTNLIVQGCMSEAACNLLNETREIGKLSVSENCGSDGESHTRKASTRSGGTDMVCPRPYTDPGNFFSPGFLICQWGIMINVKENLSQDPEQWNRITTVKCGPKEVCQETLLLIDVGPKSLILGSKGCSNTETQNSKTVSIHSGPPGVLVASYAHFCSSNLCNRANSSSVLLNSLPRPAVPVPGDLQCPACVQLGQPCTSFKNVSCPTGTTHCYKGHINVRGGGLTTPLSIQGCMPHPSSSLLNHTKNIGQFIADEDSENSDHQRGRGNNNLQSGAAPAPNLAWVVVLGLSLALSFGMTSLLTPLPHDFSPLLTP